MYDFSFNLQIISSLESSSGSPANRHTHTITSDEMIKVRLET